MKTKIIIIASVLILIGAGFALNASLGHKPDRLVVKPKTIQDYFDSAYNDNMIKAGFTNTDAAKAFKLNKVRQSYKKEFGMDFFTDDEVKQFLKDNDFILGEASRYIKNVPQSAGEAIVKNTMLIKHKACVYTLVLTHDDKTYQLSDEDVLVHGQNISWEVSFHSVSNFISPTTMKDLFIPNSLFYELTYNKDIPVYVIGGANDFNREGLHIIDGILKAVPPKDPIAVVKVNDGYVQIAQW